MENGEVAHEFRFFRAYKDGRTEIFYQTQKVPPSIDPNTGVQSKDVTISTKPPVSARIFLPKIHDPTQKLPVLYYIHGGGFCFESAFSPIFHNHLMALAAQANVIAVSIEYGLFPERPLPGCYEDSWAGLQWVATHVNGNGPESWLNDHADFNRFFTGGDSGGANVGNYLAVRVGSEGLPGLKIVGMVMVHPFFGGMEDDEMWMHMNPTNSGLQDPKLKPPAEDLAKLACDRILIFFAEKDHLREVGGAYYEDLKKSGYKGIVEVVEHEGEAHEFHLFNPASDNAASLMKKFASFLNQE